jgi:hypothetical protein
MKPKKRNRLRAINILFQTSLCLSKTQYNFGVPLYVWLGVATANFFYCTLALPESLPPELRSKFELRRLNPFHSFALLNRNRVTLITTAIFLLSTFAEGFADVLIVFWKMYDMSPLTIGILYSVLGAW